MHLPFFAGFYFSQRRESVTEYIKLFLRAVAPLREIIFASLREAIFPCRVQSTRRLYFWDEENRLVYYRRQLLVHRLIK